jgi:hypothetical protein
MRKVAREFLKVFCPSDAAFDAISIHQIDTAMGINRGNWQRASAIHHYTHVNYWNAHFKPIGIF